MEMDGGISLYSWLLLAICSKNATIWKKGGKRIAISELEYDDFEKAILVAINKAHKHQMLQELKLRDWDYGLLDD